jgi:hypothetical protein
MQSCSNRQTTPQDLDFRSPKEQYIFARLIKRYDPPDIDSWESILCAQYPLFRQTAMRFQSLKERM